MLDSIFFFCIFAFCFCFFGFSGGGGSLKFGVWSLEFGAGVMFITEEKGLKEKRRGEKKKGGFFGSVAVFQAVERVDSPFCCRARFFGGSGWEGVVVWLWVYDNMTLLQQLD